MKKTMKILLIIFMVITFTGCSNKAKNLSTSLKENQFNILSNGDTIDYQVEPSNMDVEVNFDNNDIKYDNGIKISKESIKSFERAGGEMLIDDGMLYVFTERHEREYDLQGIDLHTKDRKFYTSAMQGKAIVDGLAIDVDNNLNIQTPEYNTKYTRDGKLLKVDLSKTENYSSWTFKQKVDGILIGSDSSSTIEFNDIFKILHTSTNDGNIISCTEDDGNYYFIIEVKSPSLKLDIKNGNYEQFEKGYHLVKMNKEGKILSKKDIGDKYSKSFMNAINGNLYITNISDSKNDKKMEILDYEFNNVGEHIFKSVDAVSVIYQLNEQEYGLCIQRNGGLEIQSIFLSKLTVKAGNKEKEYKTLVFPGANEMESIKSKYETFCVIPTMDEEQFYLALSNYCDAIAYHFIPDKSTVTKDDFKNPEFQKRFLWASVGILDVAEGDAFVSEYGTNSYTPDVEACKKAIKKHLGVEATFKDGDLKVLESGPDAARPFGVDNYKCKYEVKEDITTIQYYLKDGGELIMTLKIKGGFKDRDFTIISANFPK